MKKLFNYPETYSYYLVDSYQEYLSLYHDSAYLTINEKDIPLIEEEFFESKMLFMFTLSENSPVIRSVSRKDEKVHFQLNDKTNSNKFLPSLYAVEFDKEYLLDATYFTAYVKYKEYDFDVVLCYKELSYDKVLCYEQINEYEVFYKDKNYYFFYNKKLDNIFNLTINNLTFTSNNIENIYYYDFSNNTINYLSDFYLFNTYQELLHKYFYYSLYYKEVLNNYYIIYNKTANFIYETAYLDENNEVYLIFTFIDHNDLDYRYLDFGEFVIEVNKNEEILIYNNNNFIDLMSAYENGIIEISTIKVSFNKEIIYK
jgi:hypothetical protein